MFSRITSVLLVLALVVAGFWGYREHKEKQALLLKAENQYQRSFHDLSDHMNLLQDELGKSLAVNSKKQLTNSLTESWRLAAEARNDVGALPLSLMPFNKTMEFLNDIGNFSYRVSVMNEGDKPLNEQQWQTLQELYKRSKHLEGQLGELQTAVIKKNLRWMDAELALTQTDKQTDNQIVDGFRAMEKSIRSNKPLQFGPTMEGLKNRNNVQISNLTGNNATPKTAEQKIRTYLGLNADDNVTVKKNGKGDKYPSYSAIVDYANGQQAFLTLTLKGAHITNYMNNRAVDSESLDLDQASRSAVQWLKLHGYEADHVVNVDTYDHVGVYDIVPVQDGARIYSDKVTVKVALDNGKVVGVESEDYVFHHKKRNLPKPKITQQQAAIYVSPKVKVEETHLSLVTDMLGRERLAYEFVGTMDDDTYKIYISALDGDEVGVEKLN
ncbi:MAG TPA: germination protein YpeB [Bacilli bacterium]|nr:germination protein YpeB [Bacilli bacterium]